jgi:hypothetical protein
MIPPHSFSQAVQDFQMFTLVEMLTLVAARWRGGERGSDKVCCHPSYLTRKNIESMVSHSAYEMNLYKLHVRCVDIVHNDHFK